MTSIVIGVKQHKDTDDRSFSLIIVNVRNPTRAPAIYVDIVRDLANPNFASEIATILI